MRMPTAVKMIYFPVTNEVLGSENFSLLFFSADAVDLFAEAEWFSGCGDIAKPRPSAESAKSGGTQWIHKSWPKVVCDGREYIGK